MIPEKEMFNLTFKKGVEGDGLIFWNITAEFEYGEVKQAKYVFEEKDNTLEKLESALPDMLNVLGQSINKDYKIVNTSTRSDTEVKE